MADDVEGAAEKKPFFVEITGENVEDHGPTEVESLCMECERNVREFLSTRTYIHS